MEDIKKETKPNIENKEILEDKKIILKNTNNIKNNLNKNNLNENNLNLYNKYKKIIIICGIVILLFILIFYYKINIYNLFQFSFVNNSIDTLENKDAEKITIKNEWDLETEIQKLLQKQNIYIQEKKI